MLPHKPWRLEQVVLPLMRLCISWYAGMVVVTLLAYVKVLRPGQMNFLASLVSVLSFHVMALLLFHAFFRQQNITWEEAFGLRTPRLGRTLLLALVVALAAFPIAESLAHISVRLMDVLHLKPVVQTPVEMLQKAGSIPLRIWIGFMAVLIAPLAEEVVFRGVIYPTLKQQGFPRLALWGTALLFAGFHFNLAVLVPLTFLGVVWTLLYETTGNLFGPILAHSLFNLMSFLWVIFQPVAPMPGSPP